MPFKPPTRRVPACTRCFMQSAEHASNLRKRHVSMFTQNSASPLETIPWIADAPTRFCAICRQPTYSGLTIEHPGPIKRACRFPFRSLARLRLRKGTT